MVPHPTRLARALAVALSLTSVGCYQAHLREGSSGASDAASSDAFRADTGTTRTDDASAARDDAFSIPETTYTLTTGQCFTLATRTIMDGGGMRCGDFTLEGAFVSFITGVDGTLCEVAGTFTTLASMPTSVVGACGRVVNLQIGDGTNLGFLVRIGPHLYRVHVLTSTPPTLVFSFDQVA